jgi:uncharacterized protein (TIGR03437 family)
MKKNFVRLMAVVFAISGGIEALHAQGVTIDRANIPPNAEVGVLYNNDSEFAFGATGSAPFNWYEVTTGASNLPPGFTLSSFGILSASTAPTVTGTYTFTVGVQGYCDCDIPPTDQAQFTIHVFAPLQITSPSTLPGGSTASSYSYTFTAQGGNPAYLEWSIDSGTARRGAPLVRGGDVAEAMRLQPRAQCSTGYGVPPGLCLTSAGVLQGFPTATGTFNFSVLVYDGDIQNYRFQNETMTIFGGSSLLSLSGPVNLGTVRLGSAVSGAVTASGGTQPYTFTVTAVPAGMTSSGSGVSGTPTVAGNYSVAVKVTDAMGATASSSINFSVFGFTTTALPAGVTGSPYLFYLAAAGGMQPYTFTATGLPPKFSITPAGLLNGTPATTGSYSISCTVTDANGLTSTASFPFAVSGPGPLTVPGGALSNSTVQVPISQTLSAMGGAPPYTWSLAGGGFPDGMTLRPSGAISGTPNKPGTYTFSARATDITGGSGVGIFTMTVTPQPLTILTPTPLSTGMVTVDYPVQVLTASGGSGSYTFSAPANSLPPGLTLDPTGTISGTPTTVGDYTFTVTVADSNNTGTGSQTGTAALEIKVRPYAPDLMLSFGSLAFSLAAGSAAVPAPDAVQVESTDVTKPLQYSVVITGAPTWLSVTGAGTATTPGSTPGSFKVTLTSAALSLAASATPYQAQVVVTCVSPSPCAGNTQTVNVTLTVKSLPPLLTVLTNLLSFTTSPSNPQATSETFGVENTGGGSIGFASITCSPAWCRVGAIPAGLGGGVSGDVSITADPSGLNAGFYYAEVTIVSSVGTTTVPVDFFIAANSTLALDPAGTELTMQAGGQVAVPEPSFNVDVSGTTAVPWTATVLPGAPWLSVANTSGSSTGTAPSTINYSVDQTAVSALNAGTYYATIRVTAPSTVNSPQDFQLVLNVLPANKTKPQPTPAGLLFITSATGTPPPQIDTVFASSVNPVTYQANAVTEDGGNWLITTKTVGSTSVSAPGRDSISVNPAGLNPGTYHGTVTYSLSASGVRSVNVTLVVLAPGLSPSEKNATGGMTAKAQAVCAPTKLVPTQTGLVSNFAAPAAWPTPLEITLADDCGNPVASGHVVATFSNGDPPLAFTLADPVAATYSATWTPRHSASQVTVAARASATGFADVTAQIVGSVVPNVAPVLTPNGTLHVFNPQIGAPLAPGTIVQIYGSQLANTTLAGTTIPLATTLAGTSVLIGGVQAPLFFVSAGQVNAQVPFELAGGQPYQVIVNNNGALSTPNSIEVSSVTPGVAELPSGAANAQHVADGSAITEASPAKPGEYIVLYSAGMGATTVPVASGAASPSNPLASTQTLPTVTLNGEAVTVIFSGLTPGLAGLYQVDLQIPADAPNGDLTMVVTQPGGATSSSVILPVHN